jgi:hypothetical protein
MKRLITGLILSFMVVASALGQTVITDSGKDIVIESGAGEALIKRSYPKSQLGTELRAGQQLSILLGRQVIKIIKDVDRATTTPASTSLADLQSKILAMFPAAAGVTMETDPVFTSSPAAGITAPNITNWNSAYGLVGNTVNLADDQTITGNKTFTSVITSNGMTPSSNNSFNLGSTTSRFLGVYAGNYLNVGNVSIGATTAGATISFRQGSSSQFISGFQPTTGNAYDQAPGPAPADNTYRRSIYGTLLTTGKADFTGPYTGGQITVGSTGEAGNIVMNNGSNGTGIFTIGYAAANSTTPTIQSTGANGLNVTATGSGVIVQGTGSGGLVKLRTGNADRVSISSAGQINFQNVPTYADNAAATSGGLVVGDVYRTATGQLMIRF